MVDVIVIGAGPYGLSIAAYLRTLPLSVRIFGAPMKTWSRRIKKEMLKSDGFASNLDAPGSTLTLRAFCAQQGLPYDDTNIPILREIFVA